MADSALVDSVTPSDDSSSPMEAAVDSAVPDSGAECEGITASTTDVHVDAAATVAGTGSKGCPFKTILEAIAAPLDADVNRTIHVAEGRYEETGAIITKKGMTIVGAGSTKTTLAGKGVCPEAYMSPSAPDPMPECTVFVAEDATLESVKVETVMSGGSAAIAIMTATAGRTAIRDVHVLPYGRGIVTNGSADLVDVHIEGTSGSTNGGIQGFGTGTLKIRGATVIEKLQYGAGVVGNVTLDADGLVVRDCQVYGLIIVTDAMSGSPIKTHTLRNATITGNGFGDPHGVGINAATVNLVVRNSTILGNATYGIFYYPMVPKFALDLGTPTDPGNNVFGGASASKRNKCGAVRIRPYLMAPTFPAAGNSWSTCPPAQTAESDPSCTSYQDIVYVDAPASPLVTSSCTVGP